MSVEIRKFTNVSKTTKLNDLAYRYQIGYVGVSKDFLRVSAPEAPFNPISGMTLPVMLRGCSYVYDYARGNTPYLPTSYDQWYVGMQSYKPYELVTYQQVTEYTGWSGNADLIRYTRSGNTRLVRYVFNYATTGFSRPIGGGPDWSNTPYTQNSRLIHQTNNTLYYIWNQTGLNDTTSFTGLAMHSANCLIMKIDKSEFSTTQVIMPNANVLYYTYSSLSVIYEDEKRTLMLCTVRQPDCMVFPTNGISFVSFDKLTGTITESANAWGISVNTKVVIGHTKVFKDSTNLQYMFVPRLNATNSGYDIYKVLVDTVNPVSTYNWSQNVTKPVFVNGTEHLTGYFVDPQQTNAFAGRNTQCNLFYYESSEKRYLLMLSTPVGPTSLPLKPSILSKAVLFEYTEKTDTFQYIWHEEIPLEYFVFLPNNDASKFLVASTNKYFLYKFTTAGLVKYDMTTLTENIDRICYEETGDIWIQTASGISQRSESLNAELMISVKPSGNKWVSGPFPADSGLDVIIYNKNGTQVSQYVTLNLENAKFKVDGSTSYRFITNLTGALTVPIQVTGAGPVKVTATGF